MNELITDLQLLSLLALRRSSPSIVASYGELLNETKRLGEREFSEKSFEQFQILMHERVLAEKARSDIARWREQGIRILVFGEPEFPEILMKIPDPIPVLFIRGDLPESGFPVSTLAIVGARKADMQGCEIAATLAAELARCGATIVSGLALGIDGSAHDAALSAADACSTIAVLGNGLSTTYPRAHELLAERIVEQGGLLISQFEPEIQPYPSNFLNRNRIIAALSLGTLVIQASLRSGSLVTARYALEYGRELFVTPGAMLDSRYAGSNELLKFGAYLTTCTEDIWNVLPMLRQSTPPISAASSAHSHDPEEEKILAQLRVTDVLHFDQLLSLGVSDLHSVLLELEMRGVVVRLPGNRVGLSVSGKMECARTLIRTT